KPRRGLLHGCAVAIGLFCTCQICCTDYEGPWSRKKRDAWCDDCDCDCCNCDGCDCCNCDGCCCDGCDCDCGCS
ncbi:regulatory protein, partial [Streptomyces sp. RSD-27]